MRRGEVWWVEFDPSIGSEIRKTRPAVIISNDAANRNLARVVVVPITSKVDRVYPGECLLMVADQPGKAMSDQIMAADKRRLKSRIDTLDEAEMRRLEEALMLHFALNH
jgi:mRNA interferase MazF